MYQQCTNPTTTTTSRKRRRRAIATSCLSIATFLLTSSTLLVVDSTTATTAIQDGVTATNDEQQQTYSSEEMTKHHSNNHYTTITKWKRALSSSSSTTSRTSFNYNKLRPLDLVIDNTDTNKHSPRVYQVGIYGQLEPYNEINYEKYVGFVDLSLFTTSSSSVEAHSGSGANVSGEEASTGNEEVKTTREGVITHNKKPIGKYTRPAFRTNDNDSHYQSKRLGMSNFDKRRGIGIDSEEREEEEAVERRKERELINRGLRGGVAEDENVEENVEGKEMLFPYTAENDPWELEEDELYEINEDRLLSSANTFASHHGKSSSSHADNFQNSHILPSKQKGGTSSKKQKLQQKVSQAPIISSTFPPPDVHIGKHQTFGATVYGVDNGGVEQRSINAKVCVQFQDAHGGRSTCFDLDRVGGHKDNGETVDRDRRELLNCAKKKHKDHPRCKNKQDQGEEDTDGSINLGGEEQQVQQEEAIIHEKIFEGFQAFSGQRWKFRIRAVNNDKVRVMSHWQKFTISEYLGQMPEEEEEEIEESTTSSTAAPPQEEEEEEVESVPPAPPTKLLEEVRDENWPHGGKFLGCVFGHL